MVHCLAGVSRSVCLVLAYLIKCREMSYQQAYNMIKTRRRIVEFSIFRFTLMTVLSGSSKNLKLNSQDPTYINLHAKTQDIQLSLINICMIPENKDIHLELLLGSGISRNLVTSFSNHLQRSKTNLNNLEYQGIICPFTNNMNLQ